MSHTTEPVFSFPSTRIKEVEDYLIVPKNSEDRPAWNASNDLYTGLVTSVETDFGFNFFDFFLPPGGGPPLHYHLYEHEAWYVTEGELFFSFGNQAGGEMGTEAKYTLQNVSPGTLIFGPRIKPHSYGNIDSTASTVGENVGARTLSLTTPGGLDLFFDYVGTPIEDRNAPIPPPEPVDPAVIPRISELGARISGAPYFILPNPDYEPPKNALDYVVVLPENPDADLVNAVLPLSQVDGFSIWQIDNNQNIPFPSRPTFTGAFGIEYTSLLTLEETRNEFAYNQFSLAPQITDDFPDPVVSENQEVFYVKEGQLSFKIGDEVKLAEAGTSIYIAPGNEYALANLGDAELESLQVSVIPLEDGPVVPDDQGYNCIKGSKGDDVLLASSKDKLLGYQGDDIFKISRGGDNLLYGGAGADQFWIADGSIPDTVVESRQLTDFGLPPLLDTQNTIVDFELGVDKIFIQGINGISSFDDLKLLPAFGDIRSTSILAKVDGIQEEISLANVTGVIFNQLSAENFVFA